MSDQIADIRTGGQPLMAVALHDGHQLREELVPLLEINDADRLREEDPFTGRWTEIADHLCVVRRSRFEVDLNRARETAVYITPEDAWGLKVWKARPSQEVINRSLAVYDAFYDQMHPVFSEMRRRFGKFVVFDLHAYNYRRNGPDGEPADPAANPEVNVGTGTMTDRSQWAPVIDRFIQDLSRYDYLGRHLDVRENIKFYGRRFAERTHQAFRESACVLSVEFKKFFMDEWTGQPDERQLQAVTDALASTVPGVLKELEKLS